MGTVDVTPQATPQPPPQAKSLRDDPAFMAVDWAKVSELTEALGWKKVEVATLAKERLGLPLKEMGQEQADELARLLQEELDQRLAKEG